MYHVGPVNKSKEKKKSHRKVTKLVLTVITVYVLCWLPYWITQVALIFTPPKQCQSKIVITIFLLAGCLSYSNSAMNPILYAFLSDNFKKSFLKACTCAAGKDVNAGLHQENSTFPRRNRGGSERGGGRTGRATTILCQAVSGGTGGGGGAGRLLQRRRRRLLRRDGTAGRPRRTGQQGEHVHSAHHDVPVHVQREQRATHPVVTGPP
ncbi:hypothetical protein AGLY_007702, partial [Aphis glycines]